MFKLIKDATVTGNSMHPTFKNQQKIKMDCRVCLNPFRKFNRYDVVCVNMCNSLKDAKQKDKPLHLKRIIGLPGEQVACINDKIRINGKEIHEPYINDEYKSIMIKKYGCWNKKNEKGKCTNWIVDLKKDEYFVLGDNRTLSSDSRYYGPVIKSRIIGKVVEDNLEQV